MTTFGFVDSILCSESETARSGLLGLRVVEMGIVLRDVLTVQHHRATQGGWSVGGQRSALIQFSCGGELELKCIGEFRFMPARSRTGVVKLNKRYPLKTIKRSFSPRRNSESRSALRMSFVSLFAFRKIPSSNSPCCLERACSSRKLLS